MESLDQRITIKFSDMEMVREPRVLAAKQVSYVENASVDSPHNSSEVMSNVSSVDFQTMLESENKLQKNDKLDRKGTNRQDFKNYNELSDDDSLGEDKSDEEANTKK